MFRIFIMDDVVENDFSDDEDDYNNDYDYDYYNHYDFKDNIYIDVEYHYCKKFINKNKKL